MDVSVRHLSRLFVAVMLLAGCQAPNPSIELLESELRWMEDQLYALDRQLDQTYLQLASAQNSNRALQRELARMQQSTSPPAAPPSEQEGSPPSDRLVPPGVEVPDDLDEEDLEVPRIELGPAGEVPSSPDAFEPPANDSPPRLDEDMGDLNDLSSGVSADAQVARIALNSHLTGGYDFDGQPGDEGLLVVVEPQDEAGQYVPLPGDLAIEVRDPHQAGAAAHVARWEFDSDETAVLFKRSLLGRGIHLKLPWPGSTPRSEQLLLSVRFAPPAGRPLGAERPIRVDLTPALEAPRSGELLSARAPNPLLPASTPQPNQLLPDHALTMPTGPLREAELAGSRYPTRDVALERAQIARRSPELRPAAGRAPQWRPYR